jgi:type I restriction enzyme S subunit
MNSWQKEKFEKVFARIPNKKYQISSSEYLKSGDFPVIDQGKEDVVGFCNNKEKVFKNNGVILFGDHTRILKYIDYDFIVGADGTQLIKTKEGFLNKFFYYSLLTKKIPNTGYNRHFKYVESEIYDVPPIEEQGRIVRVLECWDGYLEKLNRKIKVKKNIKKALMQKLLTGEKRLGGFSDKWQAVKLGEVCDVQKGKDLSIEKLNSNGKYECVLYGQLYTRYAETIRDVKSHTDFNEGVESIEGDILIPASTTTCNLDLAIAACVCKNNVLLGGDINILRKKKDCYDPVFLAYYLRYIKKYDLARLAQGFTIVHLYGKDFKKIKITIPEKKEQEKIISIIVSADDEIKALEKKKEIVEVQKKFLLNNLVTGNILTPESL